jgi:4-hydroxybenzoate polyprenyltransferase
MLIMIILLGAVGAWFELSWPWYASSLAAALLFCWQLFSIRGRDRDACFKAFLNNNWVGLALFVGVLGHFAVSGVYY